jgi:hypothetical protein
MPCTNIISIIVQGFALLHVAPVPYCLVTLPLALAEGDGTPIRAMV